MWRGISSLSRYSLPCLQIGAAPVEKIHSISTASQQISRSRSTAPVFPRCQTVALDPASSPRLQCIPRVASLRLNRRLLSGNFYSHILDHDFILYKPALNRLRRRNQKILSFILFSQLLLTSIAPINMHSKIWSLALFTVAACGQKVLIPTNSFSSFGKYWNNLYPDGSDHNGGARMDKEHVSIDSGNLVITAEPVEGEPPSYFGGRVIPINYRSGAIHAKENFTVRKNGGLDFSAEFIAPVEKGTWPAFWLTGVDKWPPEIDIAEWMGDGKILFNTYNTSTQMTSKNLVYKNPDQWHSVRCEIRDENGSDVRVQFYYDGQPIATQYGAGFVNQGLHL